MYKRAEYGPQVRENLRFGFGEKTTFSADESNPDLLRSEALLLGWSHGCPIAERLTGPESEYPLIWVANRYAQVNRVYSQIVSASCRYDANFYDFLNTPQQRLLNEPLRDFDLGATPIYHFEQIAPMSGIDGYALPRLVILAKRRSALVNQLARMEEEPGQRLAVLAGLVFKEGVDPINILEHCYDRGILDMENTRFRFVLLAEQLEHFAPDLWAEYRGLSSEDRSALNIAEVPKL